MYGLSMSIEETINQIRKENKKVVTNIYTKLEEGKTKVDGIDCKQGSYIVLFKPERDYHRMYYCFPRDAVIEGLHIPEGSCVCNVLSRNHADVEENVETFLNSYSFKTHAIWEKWESASPVYETTDLEQGYHVSEKWDWEMCQMLNEHFDTYSDELPTEDSFSAFMGEKRTIRVQRGGNTVAFFVYHQNGRVMEGDYLYVIPQARKMNLASAIYRIWFEQNRDEHSRYVVWIRNDNVASMKFHIKHGFHKTGIKNTVFLKETQ